jgi:hypothetical protein
MRAVAIAAIALVGAVGCSSTDEQPPPVPGEPGGWGPGTAVPSTPHAELRGHYDVRGLIHSHSVYSHDACDGEPREGDENTGPINEPCLDDFRRDMCTVKHDFIMLTDHGTSFGSSEYPDVLLHRAGDELIEHDGLPTGNRAVCADGGSPVTILAGTETGTMPVGIEGHVADEPADRMAVYSAATAEAIDALKAQGAVALVAHTEDWTVEQLTTLPLDGFEMYNVHANLVANPAPLLDFFLKLDAPEELPDPDALLIGAIEEDPRYLETWAAVLAGGIKRVTTMGSDCHRNTFPTLLEDGERVDSYRRCMSWFSNHLLVARESYDDRDLKDALREGRLYGSFDILGYPKGFDFHAEDGGASREMGSEVTVGATLVVVMPEVTDLGADVEPPTLTARILRAETDHWEVVDEADADLSFTTTEPGAYRAEIRMQPRHLRYWLEPYGELADKDFAWVYANPIYVR